MQNLKPFTIVVPARSGSKRLKNKNLLEIEGKSLIHHTLEFASSLGADRIVLSSDSREYLSVASHFSDVYEHHRDSAQSLDATPANSVVSTLFQKGVIQTEIAVMLQPTSPFRLRSTFFESLQKAIAGGKNILSVSPYRHGFPEWSLRIDKDGMPALPKELDLKSQSQDVNDAYFLNGNLAIFHKSLSSTKELRNEDTEVIVCQSPFEEIDIDSEFDLLLARRIWHDFKRD